MEEGLKTPYNNCKFRFLNEIQKLEVKLLEEKKRNVLHRYFIDMMKTPSSFIDIVIVGKILTLFRILTK